MKQGAKLLIVVCACLLLNSCSSNLTRGKAEEIMRSKAHFPINGEVDDFYLYWGGHCFQNYVQGPCGPDAMANEKPAMSEHERALLNSGLITVTYEGDTSRIALTSKGQQFAVGTPTNEDGNDGNGNTTPLSKILVVKTTVDFGEITGITQAEESKTATVEYTLVVKPTPFGIAYGLTPTTLSQTARFMKYDDGWRIAP